MATSSIAFVKKLKSVCRPPSARSYQNWGIEEGDSFYKGSSVELRYALANWNKIPLNPTLYGEWTFNDAAPDKWELKLLLGQTFGRRWNWAGNFTYEQETGGEREQEVSLSNH